MVRDNAASPRLHEHAEVRRIAPELERQVRDGLLTPTLAAERILEGLPDRLGWWTCGAPSDSWLSACSRCWSWCRPGSVASALRPRTPAVHVAAVDQPPTTTAPAGPALNPQQASNKSQQKLIIGFLSAVLLVIVLRRPPVPGINAARRARERDRYLGCAGRLVID